FKKKLVDEMPPQIKLISPIKRSEIASYYTFADAVIANLFIGTFELVGLESVMCGTPVIQYSDQEKKIIVDGKEIKSPFLPFHNDPKSIAEVIDRVVAPLRVKLRMIGFLITNRLYASKIKKVMSGSAHYKTGQAVYDNPS
ncbi:D-inositol 3-phosphate glycosyltransferase protein, partial [Marine Group I thaumarchaeote SCGC AAA799-B03]